MKIHRIAPQAIFFGYHTSSIAISFIKLDENAGFLPKIPYKSSEYIYGIFGAGLKISPIYMEIPYVYMEKTTLVRSPHRIRYDQLDAQNSVA